MNMESNDNTTNTTSDIDAVISLFANAATGAIRPADLFESIGSASRNEIKRLRAWAIGKGCAAKDFDRAARNWNLVKELGRIPENIQDFVSAYADQLQVTCGYDGSIKQPTQSDFSIDYTRVDFERDALLANDRLCAGFDKSLIRHAVDRWIRDAKPQHLAKVWDDIDDPESTSADEAWHIFVKAFVDTQAVSPAYAAAVFKKFFWQVKRKMRGFPVTNHLMPVLCGPQGNGKSSLVQALLAPLSGCERRVNFAEITDGRNIEMWSSYVLFADEMEKAAKADIEAIKNAITASVLSRRILGTGSMAQVTQCSTLIGATNGTLGSNIRDTSGLRRFAPIPTLRKPGDGRRTVDWGALNQIDFSELWRSVQLDDPDPMIAHMTELERLQEEERERSPTELWLAELDLDSIEEWHFEPDGSIKAAKLFEHFKEFERLHCPGVFKLSSQAWGREMKQLLAHDPVGAKFSRKRSSDGFRYIPNRKKSHSDPRVIDLCKSLRKAS